MWLGFFLVLIIGHVAGNALGTRLREHSTRQTAASNSPLAPSGHAPAAPNFTPARRLTEKTRLSHAISVAAGTGAVLGGVTGGLLLTIGSESRIAWPGIALATFSSAVLGGFAGFLASSFLFIGRRAWREAIGKHDPPARQRSACR